MTFNINMIATIIFRWGRDNVNFSISCDDRTCFDNTMLSELKIAHNECGLTIDQLKLCVSCSQNFS